MTSPTARSLALLKAEGWTAAVVEKWISYRDAKLDALIWQLVDELLGRNELATADPKNLEKWSRQADAIQTIRNVRPRYKPPVMPGIRKDVYGFGDILACRSKPGLGEYVSQLEGPDLRVPTWYGGIMIVQATSFANLNARIVKAKQLREFEGWQRAGGLVEFHGWRVRKLKRGDGSTCKRVRFPVAACSQARVDYTKSGREDDAS